MLSKDDLLDQGMAPIMDSSETSTSRIPEKETIDSKLERLSKALINALNARDFAFESEPAQELLAHIADGWKAQMDAQAGDQYLVDWSAQVELWKKRAQEYPDVHIKIVDVWANVHERKTRAEVFMSMEITGIIDLALHVMHELKWRKVVNDWQFYFVTGMRGVVPTP